MSGIAGIIHFDGRPVEPGRLEAMTSAMTYRGPDGIHHCVQGPVGLAHCMLRTTPESLEEKQPLANEDGSVVLAMDGRIDNWEGLRRELLASGAHLRTRADAELVLRAYEAWGERCLDRIDGDFSLVIWNQRTQTAFCARDRVGIKPLFYAQSGSSFLFASELGALLASGLVERTLNPGRIAEYLADRSFGGSETFYASCRLLRPATSMTIGPSSMRETRYWAPEDCADLEPGTPMDMAEQLAGLIKEATRRRLRSIRPVGALLSGGIDSTMIACTATDLLASRGVPADQLATYSLIYPGLECDEREEISAMVGKMGWNSHFFDGTNFDPASLVAYIRESDGMIDSPTGKAFHPLYAEAAKRGPVLLGGWGGDDWLGVYHSTYADLVGNLQISAISQRVRRDHRAYGRREAVSRLLSLGVRPWFASTVDTLGVGRLFRRWRRPRAPRWLGPELEGVFLRRASRFTASNARTWHSNHRKATSLWLRSGMFESNAVLQERGCALRGVEGRYPFHDRSIIEFATALPLSLRSQLVEYKQLLHMAFRIAHPQLWPHRFAAPEGSPIYAQATARILAHVGTAAPRLVRRGWLRGEEACSMVNDTLEWRKCDTAHTAVNIRSTWQVIATELWLSSFDTGEPHEQQHQH